MKYKHVCVLNLFTMAFFATILSLSQLSEVSESIFLSAYYTEIFVIGRKQIRRDFPAQLKRSLSAPAVFPM